MKLFHKILFPGRIIFPVLNLFGLLAILSLYSFLNTSQNRTLIQPEGYYFVDGDCYARMTRVRILARMAPFDQVLHQGAVQRGVIRHHWFENHPSGIDSHATAPLDYAILGYWKLLGGSEENLDRAGFWISHWMGIILLVTVWIWGWRLHLPYRWATLVLLAMSPMILHGMAPGRPDHQSLVLLLVGLALLLETAQRPGESRLRPFLAGCLWGLAFWVSWFEPLVLFAIVQIVRGFSWWGMRRRHDVEKGGWHGHLLTPAVAGLLAVFVFFFEGPPGSGLPPGYSETFLRWASQIGELQPALPWQALPIWTGWCGLLLPVAIIWAWWKSRDFRTGLWLCLMMALIILTSWHMRWGYFLVLVTALALPFAFAWLRPRWLGYLLFVFSLWPLAGELERRLFPLPADEALAGDRLAEMQELRQVSLILRKLEGDGLMAPWWLTPASVYWSGKSGVGGTSHQSLPGTLDSARFFLSEGLPDNLQILGDRKTSFVLAGNPGQVVENSSALLAAPDPGGKALAHQLTRHPPSAPNGLIPVFRNSSFVLFQILSEREQESTGTDD